MAIRTWLGAAVLVVVVVVTLVLVVTLGGGAANDKHPVAQPASSQFTNAPTAPTPAAATPTQKPAPKIRYVAAAGPTEFLFSGPKFRIKAHVCGMPNVRPLDPPGEQHHRVCWVDHDFGVAPGSNTATTYVLGHSWAEDNREVLNRASEPATKQLLTAKPRMLDGVKIYPVTALDGYLITLWTPKGRLTYTVRDVYGVAKSQAGNIRSLMNDKISKRIAVITCAELGGVDYDYDVIVNAFLTAAAPRGIST